MKLTSIVAAALMLVSVALPVGAAADTKHPGAAATATSGDGAYRTHFGRADLYMPASFRVIDGTYDVVLHFHGMAQAQESNVDAAGLNAVVVSLNVGIGSDAYGQAFADPRAFDSLLASTTRAVEKSGRAPGATVRKIALSAWSAGFAAVGALLKDPAAASRVDAVLLADGLHAAYTDPKHRVVDERSLGKYVRVAEAAMRGEKLFVLTHSSIPMPGYATATEACETVTRLACAEAEKEAPPASSPRKMKALYQINRGDFHVQGFEGTDVKAHLDHIWAMGATMFPLLAARWTRTADPS